MEGRSVEKNENYIHTKVVQVLLSLPLPNIKYITYILTSLA